MRIVNLRILPDVYARTSWPFSSCTRNMPPCSTSFTTPSTSIWSSRLNPTPVSIPLIGRDHTSLQEGGKVVDAALELRLGRHQLGGALRGVARRILTAHDLRLEQ